MPNLFLMVFTADRSVMTENNRIDAAPLRCFCQEYLGGTEGDVDDAKSAPFATHFRQKTASR